MLATAAKLAALLFQSRRWNGQESPVQKHTSLIRSNVSTNVRSVAYAHPRGVHGGAQAA
jgi:hypothetical protein